MNPDLTYEPYEHPPAPPLEYWWWEEAPTPSTLEDMARFHGVSSETLEQLRLTEENHGYEN
jgi:hypothetical protein